MKLAQQFPAMPESVPLARQFVLDCLPEMDVASRDEVALMTSELVTNAVRNATLYGLVDFEVTIDVSEDEIRVEVADHGAGTPAVQPLPTSTTERGRGLRIVRELSDRWGVESIVDDPGKRVWFEVGVAARRPG